MLTLPLSLTLFEAKDEISNKDLCVRFYVIFFQSFTNNNVY